MQRGRTTDESATVTDKQRREEKRREEWPLCFTSRLSTRPHRRSEGASRLVSSAERASAGICQEEQQQQQQPGAHTELPPPVATQAWTNAREPTQVYFGVSRFSWSFTLLENMSCALAGGWNREVTSQIPRSSVRVAPRLVDGV